MGIVEYCVQRERIAELRNERWLKLHWQSVQATILEAFYGAEPPLQRFSESDGTSKAAPPRAKTTYQLEVERQPLRRVTACVVEQVRGDPRWPAVQLNWDVLVCGHKLAVYGEPRETHRVRYRRCKDCTPQREARSKGRNYGSSNL